MHRPRDRRLSARLIFHADDFGLSPAVNEGIRRAHLEGVLTATSLIASGDAFDDAVRLARATPTLDVGVHLTLVEERPVLDPAGIPTLVGPAGRLHRDAKRFAARHFLGRIDPADVTRELDAQIGRVRNAGLAPSHLDSHQHLHLLPGVLGAVVELARRHGIPWIRVPREPAPLRRLGDAPLGRIAAALVLNAFCGLAGPRVPHRLAGFAGFLESGHLTPAGLRAIVGRLPARGTWEIVCHPGLDDPGSRYAHWGYAWGTELAAVTDPGVAALVRERGFSLTSFRGSAPAA